MRQIPELLCKPAMLWTNKDAKDCDIVLASRVRLARNLQKYTFPEQAEKEELANIVSKVHDCFERFKEEQKQENKQYFFVDINSLSESERGMLIAQHAISPKHAVKHENRAAILRDDLCIAVMINEEDHLRIQSMEAGLNVNDAYLMANKCDDFFEKYLTYAFDDEIGYLTSCPTNVGTGLRTSVMLHLPALTLAKKIKQIINLAAKNGLTVRGIYGEGSDVVGNIFQISNQLTLGYTEKALIENLLEVTQKIVEQERLAREVFLNEAKPFLHDKVYRAYGVLRYVRSISWQEALTLLSFVRMGADMGVLQDFEQSNFNRLLILCTSAYLEMFSENKKKLSKEERWKMRANIIRQTLQGIT